MRLRLADRYFRDGLYSDALRHYLYVLEDLEIQDPSALANVGWMVFLNGRADLAVSFVEQSLELDPNGPDALWYLANIQYIGLGDAASAQAPLQQLLTFEELPADSRSAVEELLAEVEAEL